MNKIQWSSTRAGKISVPKLLIAALALAGISAYPALSFAETLAPAVSAANATPVFIKGRILVQPRAGLSSAQFNRILQAQGGRSVSAIRELNVHIIELPDTASEIAVANILKNNPHIQFAEPDMLLPPSLTSNDPYFPYQWHLTKMQAPGAWDVSLGAGVTVAILDTGVDATHPDLAGQLVAGWNMYDNNADTSDVHGHGTKVAGVVGAASNNGAGVSSLAWYAKLMPVRISQPDGWASFSTIASGLTRAADYGARVANISYGVSGSSTVQSAAQYMKNKGGVTVVSAGNTGVLVSTAASDTMISVSATDTNDALTSWSSFGPYVDVSAPGSGIWTTVRGGGYGSVSGTSFSSPATAGTVALMLAANSLLSPANIDSLLKSSAVDLGAAGWDQYYGAGRVNTTAAVYAAVGIQPTTDTTAPTVAITSPGNGSTVAGLVPVDVAASDNVGVTRVDLLVNNVLLASDSSSPFAFSWDSATVADGAVQLVAYAYDVAGNSKASAAVSLTVKNSITQVVTDTTPPSVVISNPIDGSTIGRSVTIQASAADNVGVAAINLYIDGALRASVSGNALSFKWNTTKVKAGTHTISVKAVDTSGNATTSTVQVKK